MTSKHPDTTRIDPDRRALLKAIPMAGIVGFASGTVAAAPAPSRPLAAAGTPAPLAGRRTFPDVIDLPVGFQPEGIVAGRGTTFFVGSLASGAVYRGNLRTGEGDVLVGADDERVAIGLSYDARSDSLFVAGGGAGEGYVYDAGTGELRATYTLTAPGTFVNDVVVTRSAAYFTDSFRPVLYRVPLGPAGELVDQSAVDELPIGGDYRSVPGFNANGIDAPPDGEFLVIVNSTTGLLYRVDPATGVATEIDLGGDSVSSGDGILLDGQTLYVVRNFLNRIAVVDLNPDASAGTVIDELTDSDFAVPTTVTEFGNSLYAVNARFGTPNPESAEYQVVRVSKS
jgi:hypothetical protein